MPTFPSSHVNLTDGLSHPSRTRPRPPDDGGAGRRRGGAEESGHALAAGGGGSGRGRLSAEMDRRFGQAFGSEPLSGFGGGERASDIISVRVPQR